MTFGEISYRDVFDNYDVIIFLPSNYVINYVCLVFYIVIHPVSPAHVCIFALSQ